MKQNDNADSVGAAFLPALGGVHPLKLLSIA